MVDEVSKLSKSSDNNEEHEANIICILVTFEVSKLLTSNEVKEVQYVNIANISITFFVLKLDISIDNKLEQL